MVRAPESQGPVSGNDEVRRMVMALAAKFGGKPDAQVEQEAERAFGIARPPKEESADKTAEAPRAGRARPAGASSPTSRHSQLQGRGVAEMARLFAQPDDAQSADATWLHHSLAAIPSMRPGGMRIRANTEHRYQRRVWRMAMAELIQRSPEGCHSPMGLLVTFARSFGGDGTRKPDPRVFATYCAQHGWGTRAYQFANVVGLIHLGEDCRCQI